MKPSEEFDRRKRIQDNLQTKTWTTTFDVVDGVCFSLDKNGLWCHRLDVGELEERIRELEERTKKLKRKLKDEQIVNKWNTLSEKRRKEVQLYNVVKRK